MATVSKMARPGIRPRHNALMDLPGFFTRASRDWFRRPVLELAPLLLGCALARTSGDGTVAVRLPRSPLTYEGVIVKIRWCFRLRLFFESGRDHVSEHVFALGRVPPSLPP